jgi:L-aspartate oxidase|tara:strand:- start:27773 stop:29347 length:1575 start_codon:yes stop_codon:yes gene_type:complete
MKKTNFLIIGSGIAGLTLAIKLAERFPKKTIAIVTKAGQSNTCYAQGGIAAVLNEEKDCFQKHIDDTLRAGDGLCKPEIVEKVIIEGPKRLRELMQWGAQFDMDTQQSPLLNKEGGHSENRIVHHKDTTGREVLRALTLQVHQLKNIELLTNFFAVDLIVQNLQNSTAENTSTCRGAYLLNQLTGTLLALEADTTTLATGGVGQVYAHTTNPDTATGDGIAMAHRAKAKVSGMEFIQFHPTALHGKNKGTSFLISEAVRGFGAFLRNSKGERFMLDYDSRGELASRDIVSRAIHSEMLKHGDTCVYLDATHLAAEHFKTKFPNIYSTCLGSGYDIAKDWIPVVPAAHYLCGGIDVDTFGQTTIENLFACGECSFTGLHGANRLASNSLLEALVFAHSIFDYHVNSLPLKKHFVSFESIIEKEQMAMAYCSEFKPEPKKIQELMSNFAGIVRTDTELQKAEKQLDQLAEEVEIAYTSNTTSTGLCEYRNMLTVAQLIVGQSLLRKENKGGYYNAQLENNTKKELI